MSSSEQAESGMSADHPVSVVLPPELIQAHSFRHVPHSDRLVFRVTYDELLFRVKYHARDVVVVATARVDFPRFRL